MGGGTETRAPPGRILGGHRPPKKIYKKEKIYKKGKKIYKKWSKKSIKKEKRKKSIKSGLKTRLKRFKNKKFSYPGEGDTPSPGPHPPRRGPTGLGADTRPFGPRWCPPLENFPLRP